MGIDGQKPGFGDGIETLYIDGVKFQSERKNDELYVRRLADARGYSKWIRNKNPYMNELVELIERGDQSIESFASGNGTEHLISAWRNEWYGSVCTYNPSMKDNGVILTRRGDTVLIKVKYDSCGVGAEFFDDQVKDKGKIIETGLAKWANQGYGYVNDKKFDMMGGNDAIYVRVEYDFEPGEKSLMFRFSDRLSKYDKTQSSTRWARDTDSALRGEYVDGNSWCAGLMKIVNLYPEKSTKDPSDISMFYIVAHEFGHVLGLSDAYSKGGNRAPRVTNEIPHYDIMRSPQDSDFNYRGVVTPNDIEMMLLAYMKNEMQWFYSGMGLSEAIRDV